MQPMQPQQPMHMQPAAAAAPAPPAAPAVPKPPANLSMSNVECGAVPPEHAPIVRALTALFQVWRCMLSR
jgi:protein transport protein SEC31